jgi:poly-gamma-glutamate synthesis protein (capsule biosynthesis protein)
LTSDSPGLKIPSTMPSTSILCVGDLQLGDSSIITGFGIASLVRDAASLTAVMGPATSLPAEADFTFGNLETGISRAGLVRRSLQSAQMRGRPEFAQAIREAGFDVVNFANNHCNQHGEVAFRETLALLSSAGVAACGIAGSEPVVLSAANGTRVGFLAYSRRPRQWNETRVPYVEGSDESIVADVERLAADVDFVVVSLHWGEEFVEQPSECEVALGHRIIDAGAALIAGHHPHVVRPVERYRNGVIAYSLGNFIGDMFWDERFRRGLMIRCEFSDRSAPDLELFETWIEDDFRVAARALPTDEWPRLEPLEQSAYAQEIYRTVGQQRRDSYGHLLKNVFRYRPGILGQLVATTLRNKLRGLAGGE